MDTASPASSCTISEEIHEMETKPGGETSTIPAPDPNAAEGTIDHVLDILNKYSHPFILVGHVALRWMGCSSSVDAGFDLVLRTSQLPAIVTSLVETGLWTIFDGVKTLEVFKSDAAWQDLENIEGRLLLEYLCDADTVLKWEGIEGIGFSYMRLWTEEAYHINVDACPLVEVPELYPWNPFLVEKQFHPALRPDDGWFYGPRILDDAAAKNDPDGIFNTIYQRTKGAGNTSPINILSIPAYLDALVYHKTHYATSKYGLASVADVQINNLTKDLFLELPHQMNPLLFQVDTETENYLQPYFAGWKRMPRYVMSLSKGRVPLNAWDPESYPEDLITPFVRMSRASRDSRQALGLSSTGAAPQ
ncbi:hypothetical protein V501_05858 [Pseudogymnoascus sp. VKM F-4519 (FW-2642)]|nr:hypothetical protein V501_05858 [Pseudogymnoascus sp. VKM F-4519 (FW-2642)]